MSGCKLNQNALNQRNRQINGSNSVISTVIKNNITTTAQADCNIYKMPENQIPNVSNYMYDEKTVLYINTSSQNYCIGQYFSPCDVNADWNYCLNNPKNLLAGQTAYSSTLGDMSNIQNLLFVGGKPEGRYSLDITNAQQTTSTTDNPLFVAIGANYSNSTKIGQFDTVPNYNQSSPISNYSIHSQYIFLSEQDLLIVTLNISVIGTDGLFVNNVQNPTTPQLMITVKNKVYSRESLKNGGSTGGVVYEHTVPLKYYQDGDIFNNSTSSYFMNQAVPLIFAPRFVSTYCYISVLYVPPVNINGNWVGQFLPGNPGTNNNGFVFDPDHTNHFDINTLTPTLNQTTRYGHFVTGFAYGDINNKYSTYLVQGIQEEVLTVNIWRSPISLYNSYKNYSIMDTNGLSVTLLFSKSYNGALYLVTNTGTPISSVVSYGILPLNNFINTMQAFCRKYDNTSSLADYFIDPYTVKKLKLEGYDVIVVQLQSVLDSVNKIKNPSNIDTLPNMNYFLLHRPNSANITIDPTEQIVINQNTGQNYFGLTNSILFSLGDNMYATSKLSILSTFNNTLFGNSIYLGLQEINGLIYHVIFTLPESAFRPDYCSDSSIIFNTYASLDTPYYVTNSIGFTRFVPNAIRTTVQNQPSYAISKFVLTVSNNIIF